VYLADGVTQAPGGGASVTSKSFTAGVTATYYVRVVPTVPGSFGDYTLRVQ
jgi:hypothetical protein